MDIVDLIAAFLLGMLAMHFLYRLKGHSPDGQIVVQQNEDGKKTFILELNKDPSDLKDKDRIIFKVTDEPADGYEEPV